MRHLPNIALELRYFIIGAFASAAGGKFIQPHLPDTGTAIEELLRLATSIFWAPSIIALFVLLALFILFCVSATVYSKWMWRRLRKALPRLPRGWDQKEIIDSIAPFETCFSKTLNRINQSEFQIELKPSAPMVFLPAPAKHSVFLHFGNNGYQGYEYGRDLQEIPSNLGGVTSPLVSGAAPPHPRSVPPFPRPTPK
jgi:hypothetical protein